MEIKNGLLEGAKQLPSPNYNARPHATVNAIIIHNISLPAGQFGTGHIEALFGNHLDLSLHPSYSSLEGVQVSAHLLITRTGAITQFVNFNERAWHAGVSSLYGEANCNDFSIGIELEGCDDTAYSHCQYQQLVAICQCLMQHYPDITLARVVGHNDIAPTRKTDPGVAFDWGWFKYCLAQEK